MSKARPQRTEEGRGKLRGAFVVKMKQLSHGKAPLPSVAVMCALLSSYVRCTGASGYVHPAVLSAPLFGVV